MPSNVEEALSGPEALLWNKAIQKELESMEKNQVWELVKLPADKVAVGSKWVFKRKTDCDGEVLEYKARLVAQGFSQKFGTDYDETFSPVIRFETVRTLIAYAVQNDMYLHHVDVCSEFLNGKLTNIIYKRQPDGLSKGDTDLV